MDKLIYFDFGPKSSTLLIFFFNGIVFSVLLFKEGFENTKRESKWLGLFILLCSLYICPFMLGYAGWYSIKLYREILFFMPFQQLFLIGPVIFFYTRSLLRISTGFSKKDLLHFLPATAYLLYTAIIFTTDKLVLDDFYFYEDGRDKDLAFWYQMTGLISMLIYLIMSLRIYSTYKILVVRETSFADDILHKWIKRFLIALTLILVLRVLFFFLNPEWDNFGSKYWYYLCFSILFFYISIYGYSNSIKGSISFNNDTLYSPHSGNGLSLPRFQKRDKGTSTELQDWKIKISTLINESEIYKNPSLTLTDVSLKLNTNRSIVSEVINKGFGMNFNDFINSKRVDAVMEKIAQGAHNSSTLLGIAMDCGFNSKATFNRAFKKNTSMTPKEYILRKEF